MAPYKDRVLELCINSTVYISRLYINVSSEFINGKIYCLRDDGLRTTLIGNLTLPIFDALGKLL